MAGGRTHGPRPCWCGGGARNAAGTSTWPPDASHKRMVAVGERLALLGRERATGMAVLWRGRGDPGRRRKRHARFSRDGTWDRVLEALLVDADAQGQLDWQVCVDSTISRVHQHGANMSRERGWRVPDQRVARG